SALNLAQAVTVFRDQVPARLFEQREVGRVVDVAEGVEMMFEDLEVVNVRGTKHARTIAHGRSTPPLVPNRADMIDRRLAPIREWVLVLVFVVAFMGAVALRPVDGERVVVGQTAMQRELAFQLRGVSRVPAPPLAADQLALPFCRCLLRAHWAAG